MRAVPRRLVRALRRTETRVAPVADAAPLPDPASLPNPALALVAASGLFDPVWYARHNPDVVAAGADPLTHFVTHGDAEGRSPGPLFYAPDYLASRPDVRAARVPPLLHFLAHGAQDGTTAGADRRLRVSGSRPVQPIDVRAAPTVTPALAVAVHVHYPEVFDEVCAAVRHLPGPVSLFVTATDAAMLPGIVVSVAAHGIAAPLYTRAVPNRGRNFAGFLVEFADFIGRHDLLLHLHTKKSLYSGAEQVSWRAHLLRMLVGGPYQAAAIVQRFADDPHLGVVTPATAPMLPYWAHHWLSSGHLAGPLWARLGLHSPPPRGSFDYPVGGMFWARVAAVAPLLQAGWQIEDFSPETGQADGTIMHAIERSIVAVAADQGFGFAEIDADAGVWRVGHADRNMWQYGALTASHARAQVEAARVVSFDLFDTLVLRTTMTPGAVHDLVGLTMGRRDFVSRRHAAEHAARVARRDQGDVDIDAIYAAFLRDDGWDDAAVARARALELEIDLRVLRPRAEGIALLRAARDAGRRCILISDTYVPRAVIDDWLARWGLGGMFDEIYLSNERGVRKDRGDMWTLVAQAEGADGLLHVGDNEQSDIQGPTDRNLAALHLMAAPNLAVLRGVVSWPAGRTPLAHDLLQGPIAARLGASPFVPGGRFRPVMLATPEDLGFVVIGPLLFAFFVWLFRHPALPHLQHLYFAAREGHALLATYEALRRELERAGTNQSYLPPGSYVHVSRQVALGAAMAVDFDPATVISTGHFEGSLAGLLQTRLGYTPHAELGLSEVSLRLPDDAAYVQRMMTLLRPEIEAHAADARAAFLAYCHQVGLDRPESVGLVDVGYSGTIQLAMQRVLGRPLVGLYMSARPAAARVEADGGYAYGALADPIDPDLSTPFSRSVVILETVFTAPHGQVTGFDRQPDGTMSPRFLPDGPAQRHFAVTERMQRGAQEYCLDLVRTLGPLIHELEIDRTLPQVQLDLLAKGGLKLSQDLAKTIIFEDDFCGNGSTEAVLFLQRLYGGWGTDTAT